MVGELGDLRRRVPWLPERIAAPLLALHGEQARPHHRRAMSHVAELVTDGRRVEIAGAGHAGPHTHPDDVADAIVDFVDTCGSGPGDHVPGTGTIDDD